MRVFITGASGLIGSHLCAALTKRGDTVVAISRDAQPPRPNVTWVQGRPDDVSLLKQALVDVDAVVNLAGASVAQRWTNTVREHIVRSRIDTTRALGQAMAQGTTTPKVLINASAVGFYGTSAEKTFDEQGPLGDGFLAEVCQMWEAAAHTAAPAGTRLVTARFGVVLAREGGALPKLVLPVKNFVGGALGDGRQWMSWVHIDDAVQMLLFALQTPSVQGPLNVVAPEAARGGEIAQTLGDVLHRPVWLPVPKFALRLLFGQMANEALLGGQHVVPKQALAAGFTYRFKTLEPALRNLLS